MNGIVEAAHLLQDTETSAQAYGLLLPFADVPMILSIGAASFGSVRHALGVACLGTVIWIGRRPPPAESPVLGPCP